jgi:hypothetical protein
VIDALQQVVERQGRWGFWKWHFDMRGYAQESSEHAA